MTSQLLLNLRETKAIYSGLQLEVLPPGPGNMLLFVELFREIGQFHFIQNVLEAFPVFVLCPLGSLGLVDLINVGLVGVGFVSVGFVDLVDVGLAKFGGDGILGLLLLPPPTNPADPAD